MKGKFYCPNIAKKGVFISVPWISQQLVFNFRHYESWSGVSRGARPTKQNYCWNRFPLVPLAFDAVSELLAEDLILLLIPTNRVSYKFTLSCFVHYYRDWENFPKMNKLFFSHFFLSWSWARKMDVNFSFWVSARTFRSVPKLLFFFFNQLIGGRAGGGEEKELKKWWTKNLLKKLLTQTKFILDYFPI